MPVPLLLSLNIHNAYISNLKPRKEELMKVKDSIDNKTDLPAFLLINGEKNSVHDTFRLRVTLSPQTVERWLNWYMNRDLVFITPNHEGMLKASREGKGPYGVYVGDSTIIIYGPVYVKDSTGEKLSYGGVPLEEEDITYLGLTHLLKKNVEKGKGSNGEGEQKEEYTHPPWEDDVGPAERSLGL